MKLSSKQIKDASQCLRYYRFSLEDPIVEKEGKKVRIVDEVLRKSYGQALETTFKPEWRRIVAWVDKRVFRDVDIDNKESFKKARAISEHILIFLRTWYRNILIPEQVLAYPSVTIKLPVSSSEVTAVLPVIKLQEKPIIFSTNSVVCHDWELYNDIDVRIQALLVSEALDCKSVIYHRIAMGPQGGWNQNMIELGKEHQKATKRVMTQVVKTIERGMDWPSFTRVCPECPYRRRCKV